MQGLNSFQASESMIGKLLVASTTVQDPILSRSVSLVVHQDSDNVYAVLLNRPMTPPQGMVKKIDSGGQNIASPQQGSNAPPPKALGRVPQSVAPSDQRSAGDESQGNDKQGADDQSGFAHQTAAEASKSLGTIHFGGPLSGPLVAVHNASELAESQAGEGVYVAAQRDVLEMLVKQRPAAFRLIVGHLGWSLEQLRSERDAGYWHVIDATEDDVFTGDQELWAAVIRRATGASLAHWIGIDPPPEHVECN